MIVKTHRGAELRYIAGVRNGEQVIDSISPGTLVGDVNVPHVVGIVVSNNGYAIGVLWAVESVRPMSVPTASVFYTKYAYSSGSV